MPGVLLPPMPTAWSYNRGGVWRGKAFNSPVTKHSVTPGSRDGLRGANRGANRASPQACGPSGISPTSPTCHASHPAGAERAIPLAVLFLFSPFSPHSGAVGWGGGCTLRTDRAVLHSSAEPLLSALRLARCWLLWRALWVEGLLCNISSKWAVTEAGNFQAKSISS